MVKRTKRPTRNVRAGNISAPDTKSMSTPGKMNWANIVIILLVLVLIGLSIALALMPPGTPTPAAKK